MGSNRKYRGGSPQAFITFGDLTTLSDETTVKEAMQKGFLSELTLTETSVSRGILTPGSKGFGCGVCSDEVAESLEMTGMPGFRDPTSRNYGNYWDKYKNIFVFIPKFYFKWEHNTVYVSATEREGYVIHRAFINAGNEIEGFFIGKYQYGYSDGKARSVPGPVQNAWNAYFYLQKARELSVFHTIQNTFMFNALAILAKCQHQDGRNCAWMDVAPYYPKGNNNHGRDYNEPGVYYIGTEPARTGSASIFEKTTHNGQLCGVCDMNGNVKEFALGLTCDGTRVYTPKLSTDMLKFTHNVKNGADVSEQCAWGDHAYLSNPSGFFEELNITGTVLTGNNNVHYSIGNADKQVFPFEANKNSDKYKVCCVGIPLISGCQEGENKGTLEFGQDTIFHAGDKVARLTPVLGGAFYYYYSQGGVWAQQLDYDCNSSNSADTNVGSRLAIIPKIN